MFEKEEEEAMESFKSKHDFVQAHSDCIIELDLYSHPMGNEELSFFPWETSR